MPRCSTFAALLGLLAGCASPQGEPPEDAACGGFEVGDTPCDFTLPDQEGAQVSLSDFRGTPVLLHFGALWAAPVQHLGETTQATADRFAGDGLVYVTVIVEGTTAQNGTVEDAHSWAEAFAIDEPVLADPTGVFDFGVLPAVFVLDGDGVVLGQLPHPVEDDSLDAWIEALIR